jgi:hypothetical protein
MSRCKGGESWSIGTSFAPDLNSHKPSRHQPTMSAAGVSYSKYSCTPGPSRVANRPCFSRSVFANVGKPPLSF